MPTPHRITTTLVVTLASLLPFAEATADEWTKRLLQVGDLSLDLPSEWTVQTAGDDRILVREYPAKEVISALSVEVFRATASLKWWTDYHRDNQLRAKYPDGKIAVDAARRVGAFPGHAFQVERLGADRRGYDLLQTIVATGKHFVIFSLYYPSGRHGDYDALFDHVTTSLRRNSEGVSVGAAPKALGPPAKDQIDWMRTFDAAFAEAERRGVPVMIAFNMDNEWANDLIASDYYRDPQIIERSRQMVCLIASVFDHGGREVAGQGRHDCDRFGRVTCSEHRDVDIAVREKYLRSKKVIAPQHIFCSPEGELLIRREWHLEKADLMKLMDRSIAAVKRRSTGGAELTLEVLLDRYKKAPDAAARDWILSDAMFSGNDQLAKRFLDTLLRSASSSEDDMIVLMDALRYAGHPAGVPTALAGLAHAADDVRSHAAVALEVIASSEATGDLLKRLPAEPSERVRKNLLRALGACANEENRIAKVLMARARKGGTLERANALIALSGFPENKRVATLLEKTLTEGDNGQIRGSAAWSLGLIAPDGARALLARQREQESDPLAVRAIDQAIEQIDGKLDWRTAYEEILENLAGDTIFRRET